MKSLLYAPRVKGDLDLGLEPSRIDPDLNRKWAEIITPGGRLPGRPYQGVNEQSETQNYRVGTRRVEGDRVWRYCYAYTRCRGRRGVFTDPQRFYATDPATPINLAAAQYATSLSFEPYKAVGEDELAEGYLSCSLPYLTQRIKSNTESVGGAGNPCVVTFEDPLPLAILADQGVTAYPNMYRYCNRYGGLAAGTIFGSVCAVVVSPGGNNAADIGNWFWGLTRGPASMIVNLWGNLVGRHQNMRLVYFGHDGGIVYQGVVGPVLGESQLQHAGRIMFDGNTDMTPHGNSLIFIELE